MIVDTSAVIAILKEEDDAAVYAKAVASADSRRLSAVGYLECGIVLDSQRDPIVSRALDDLIAEAKIVIEPLTEGQPTWPVRPTQISAKAAGIRPV